MFNILFVYTFYKGVCMKKFKVKCINLYGDISTGKGFEKWESIIDCESKDKLYNMLSTHYFLVVMLKVFHKVITLSLKTGMMN